jgi:hypothetical protein
MCDGSGAQLKVKDLNEGVEEQREVGCAQVRGKCNYIVNNQNTNFLDEEKWDDQGWMRSAGSLN